ncbi:MAG TPA: hypothetical protein VHO68_03585, partial [Bacteroidales bacterium]|nr:hypothetical protein [Bacteroidales bacterium]
NNHMGIIFDWFYRQSWNVYAYDEFLQNYRKDNSLWNSGIEGSIDYNYSKGNFRLNAVCNIASYRNLLNNNTGYFYGTGMTRIGTAVRNQSDYPLSSFFGYEVSGLFKDNTEISGAPSQDGAQPGFFRYANQNSDNIINSDDRVVLGSPNPDFTTTFDLELAYKRFDLSGLFYWSQGNEIFNFTKWWNDFWPSFSGQKSKRLLYDSWTEQNKNTSVPKASNTSNFSTNTVINSYYIEDGSYLRLKTIRLGYSFNEASLRKARISSLYLYLQAVNLFTLTKYSGLDPEIGGDATAFGIDKGNYPNTTQFMIGLRLGI